MASEEQIADGITDGGVYNKDLRRLSLFIRSRLSDSFYGRVRQSFIHSVSMRARLAPFAWPFSCAPSAAAAK
jgi:hypothetical protein